MLRTKTKRQLNNINQLIYEYKSTLNNLINYYYYYY